MQGKKASKAELDCHTSLRELTSGSPFIKRVNVNSCHLKTYRHEKSSWLKMLHVPEDDTSYFIDYDTRLGICCVSIPSVNA